MSKPVRAVPAAAPDAPPRGPGVSIVICTKDRPVDLARAIASVRTSGPTGGAAEIIVVEEGDAPRDIPGVRYVHVPREGRGFGYIRNVGLRQVRGELVLFVDDDCEVQQGWGDALVNPLLKNPELLGVAGAVLVKNCGLVGYAENILGFPGGGLRYFHHAQGQIVPTRYLSTCNCAYRRQAILQVGGFSEEARLGAEDSLLVERISTLGPCVYSPHAVVYHRARDRLGAIFGWFIRRGQSEIGYLEATAKRWKSVRYLLRSSWALRFLGIVMVLITWPWLALLIPPGMLLYYGAVLWRFRFACAYPIYRRAWLIVPVVKMTMDLGAEMGRWKALIRGTHQKPACAA